MVGLMSAIAGGLSGLGQGMIDNAKAAREAAIAALARQNAVEDRDVNIAATAKNLDTSEAGATARTKMENDTSLKTTGMNNATALQTTGMNNATSRADTATTESGANSRNKATTDTELQIANIRADAYNHKTDAIASQYGTSKPLTYNQALQTARQAYKDDVLSGAPLLDASGNPVPASQAISDIAAKLLKNNGPSVTGAPSPSGASASPSTPTGSIPVPPAYAGKPDGTILSNGTANFTKQGGYLVPTPQSPQPQQ